MADGGVGGQLDQLRKQAALEAARLANINPEGGKFHGEETLNQLQETLSSATQATSNFLEGHWWGRNLKGNLKNWGTNLAIGMQDLSEYAADEADRTPTNPGQLLGWTIGNIGRSREQYTDAATDFISDIEIGGKPIDPRITRFVTGEVLDTLATAGAGGIARKGLSILDRAVPPGTGGLVPAFADDVAGSLPVRRAGEVNDFTPSNVFQTHAGHPLAMTERTGRAADSGGDILNLERLGKAQRNNRGYNTQAATDYLKSDHNLYNIQYGLAALVGESHHVGDHGLVGSIVRALKAKKGQKLLDAMEKRYIRTGNDAFQMITVPGKGKGAGARFDHVGLFHNRWYPQIETRRILEEGVKSGDIVKWSDDRIEQLLASTLKQQQRIAIGWGKWKLDTVRQLYPETMYFKPQEMRDWLNKNPQKFAQAGTVVNKKTGKVTSTAPQHFDEISNYGRTKGQDNYTNDYLRIVFDFNFGGRTAAQGLEAPMQTKFRLRNWHNPTTGKIEKRIKPKKR